MDVNSPEAAEWTDHMKRLSAQEAEIVRLRDALDHVTELLVNSWAFEMKGDAEHEVAVIDARKALANG
jgi:hypothetical protein